MRRKYDKLKNELKAKLDLLKNYELELQKLKSANEIKVDSSSFSTSSLNATSLVMNQHFKSSIIGIDLSPSKLMNSTIITIQESTFDYSNLESLTGRIDILKMKLVNTAQRSLEAYRENTVLKEMLRKARL